MAKAKKESKVETPVEEVKETPVEEVVETPVEEVVETPVEEVVETPVEEVVETVAPVKKVKETVETVEELGEVATARSLGVPETKVVSSKVYNGSIDDVVKVVSYPKPDKIKETVEGITEGAQAYARSEKVKEVVVQEAEVSVNGGFTFGS